MKKTDPRSIYAGFHVQLVRRANKTVAGYLDIRAMTAEEVLASGRKPGNFRTDLLKKVKVPVIRTGAGVFVNQKNIPGLTMLDSDDRNTVLTLLQYADNGIKDGDLQSQYFIPARYSRKPSSTWSLPTSPRARVRPRNYENSWHQ